MVSNLATIICIIFILFLFWRDGKRSDKLSKALLVPFVWMFLAGSRYVSGWLELRRIGDLKDAYNEGSPIDAVTFFLLITAGIYILLKRNINWGRLLGQNKLIWLYFLYCGISVAWADYPFVSFKRYVKELGNVVMVLVILTESQPYEAVGVILRRLSFLLVPLSVLFVKYYPELGRAYHTTGAPMFTGVSQQKNGLGQICLIAGIYFSWNYLINRKKDVKLNIKENIAEFILIGMVAWLLYMSHSATAYACLFVSVGLFFMGSTKAMAQRPGRVMTSMIALSCLYLFLDVTVDVKDTIIGMLGRDPDLTTRVPMWQMLQGMVVNPLFGAGYMSFWSADRLPILWEKIGVELNNAHNGYLEQYLNLGYIGVALTGLIILSGLLKVRRHLNLDYQSAMLRLSFIVTAILYNYTEASFFGINNMWILLLIGVISAAQQSGEQRVSC